MVSGNMVLGDGGMDPGAQPQGLWCWGYGPGVWSGGMAQGVWSSG